VKRALLLLAATVLLASCGSRHAATAATVGATAIPSQEVLDEMSAIAENADYVKWIEDSTQGQVIVKGEETGSYTQEFVSQVLTKQIQSVLIEQAIAARKIAVTDDCTAAAETSVAAGIGGGDQATGEAIIARFSDVYREQMIRWNAEQLALEADLAGQECNTDKQAAAYFEAHKADFEEACVSHILVATKAEADSLYAQLQAGADFATLAKSDSTDGSAANGGVLGCAPKGTYVPEFDSAVFAATPGVPTEPVQTQFGWHLILVGRFQDATFDSARQQVEQTLAKQAAAYFDDWLGKARASTEVTVNPSFGTWDSTTHRVNPPSTIASTTTTAADSNP
jgi:parvulin-like peptidyl-prolyl isomerase